MTPQDICRHMVEATFNAAKIHEPCAHAYVSTFFPPLFYMHIMRAMPNIAAYQPLGERDSREDGTSTRDFVKLDGTPETPEVWRMIYVAMTSKMFRTCLLDKFTRELALRYNILPAEVVNLPITGLDLRLFRDTVDYKLAPHTDSAKKAITLQAYLPRTGANPDYGTSFYVKVDGQFIERRRMQFVPNSAYTFPIMPQDQPNASWHGRELLDHPSVERHSLIYNLYYSR